MTGNEARRQSPLNDHVALESKAQVTGGGCVSHTQHAKTPAPCDLQTASARVDGDVGRMMHAINEKNRYRLDALKGKFFMGTVTKAVDISAVQLSPG